MVVELKPNVIKAIGIKSFQKKILKGFKMHVPIEKPKEYKSRVVTNSITQKKNSINQSFEFVDNRQITIVQRKTQKMINHNLPLRINKPKSSQLKAHNSTYQKIILTNRNNAIQRLPPDTAARVNITFNSRFHLGDMPVTDANMAIALTNQRRNNQPNWNGLFNHVVYDFNIRNVENMLCDRLINDQYFTDNNGRYVVQLPDLNYYIVNRNGNQFFLGGGQCSMLIDPNNMNAFHMQFH